VVHPSNDASKRLVTRLGFVQDGKKETEDWDNNHLIFSLQEKAFRSTVQMAPQQ